MEYLDTTFIEDLDTEDIFYRMNHYLERNGYFDLTSDEDRLNLSLICFKKYLLEKLLPYNLTNLTEDSSLLEIIETISRKKSGQGARKGFDLIIHYLINLLSIYADYYVTWMSNSDPEDNENYLEFREGKIDRLITGQNIDYYKTFALLYSYLIGEAGINPDVKKLEIK